MYMYMCMHVRCCYSRAPEAVLRQSGLRKMKPFLSRHPRKGMNMSLCAFCGLPTGDPGSVCGHQSRLINHLAAASGFGEGQATLSALAI